jgi:hypothetical protein
MSGLPFARAGFKIRAKRHAEVALDGLALVT